MLSCILSFLYKEPNIQNKMYIQWHTMNYIHTYVNGANAKNGKTQLNWKVGIKIHLLARVSAAEFAFSVYLFEERCYKREKTICLLEGSELFLNLYKYCLESILALLVYLWFPECTAFLFQEAFHRFSKWCVSTLQNILKYEWDFKNFKLLRKTLNYCTKTDEIRQTATSMFYTQRCLYHPCIDVHWYLHIYIYCICIARHWMIKYVLINCGC